MFRAKQNPFAFGQSGTPVPTVLGRFRLFADRHNPPTNINFQKYQSSTAFDDTIYHKMLNLKQVDNEYVQGKNDLFALIIIMKQMLQAEDFKNMSLELENVVQTLDYNLHTIKLEKVLNRMGFPLNWQDLSKIERSIDN